MHNSGLIPVIRVKQGAGSSPAALAGSLMYPQHVTMEYMVWPVNMLKNNYTMPFEATIKYINRTVY